MILAQKEKPSANHPEEQVCGSALKIVLYQL